MYVMAYVMTWQHGNSEKRRKWQLVLFNACRPVTLPPLHTHKGLVGQAAMEGSSLGGCINACPIQQLALIEKPGGGKDSSTGQRDKQG
jgi:hypothetical protein